MSTGLGVCGLRADRVSVVQRTSASYICRSVGRSESLSFSPQSHCDEKPVTGAVHRVMDVRSLTCLVLQRVMWSRASAPQRHRSSAGSEPTWLDASRSSTLALAYSTRRRDFELSFLPPPALRVSTLLYLPGPALSCPKHTMVSTLTSKRLLGKCTH